MIRKVDRGWFLYVERRIKLHGSCISNVDRGAKFRGLFIHDAWLFVCFTCYLPSCVRMTKTSLVKNRASKAIRVHGRAVKPARVEKKPFKCCFIVRSGTVVYSQWFLAVQWFTDWANLSRKQARSLSDPWWRQRLIRVERESEVQRRDVIVETAIQRAQFFPLLSLKMLHPANEKCWCEWRHTSWVFWLVDCKRVSWHLWLGLRPFDTSVSR